MKMKLNVLLFTFAAFLSYTSRAQVTMQDSALYEKTMQIADDVRQQYAPDQRTALFDIRLDTGTAIPRYYIETTEAEARIAFTDLLKKNNISMDGSVILFPDRSVGEATNGIINLSVANLRTSPRNQAEMATQALLGTTVDLLQKKDGYFRVRTPDGYISWVNGSSIATKTDEELAAWNAHSKVIFVADFGHTFQAADESSMRVSDLVMGDILLAKGTSGDFTQVIYPDGREAFVKSSTVAAFDHWQQALNPTAQRVLDVAKTMMGLPYLWGGTSVKGVDCSGFTKTAYFMNGLIIPRDASQQVLAGLELDVLTDGDLDTVKLLRNLQPADLLFFAAAKGERDNPRVTHVALYLGDGQFIHASGTVQINSLLSGAPDYDADRANTLVAARRYLGENDPALQFLAAHPAYHVANASNE